MRIRILNQSLAPVAIINENYISLLWNENYNSVGSFSLELANIDEYKRQIKNDYYVSRDDRDTLMVIKSIQYSSTSIVITGYQGMKVLEDVAFIGTIDGGDVEREVLSAYNSSSKYPNAIFKIQNLGVNYSEQISNKSFLELCEVMAQSTDLGFTAVKSKGNLAFKFFQPTDSGDIILSQRYNNLSLEHIIESVEAVKNYAYVLGSGEGEERISVIVDETNSSQKKELIVDARDLTYEANKETLEQYKKRLKARGHEKLLECQQLTDCAFIPLAEDFGVNYDLGDILTVLLPEYNMRLKARVVSFSQKAQSGTTETTVNVGNIKIIRR